MKDFLIPLSNFMIALGLAKIVYDETKAHFGKKEQNN